MSSAVKCKVNLQVLHRYQIWAVTRNEGALRLFTMIDQYCMPAATSAPIFQGLKDFRFSGFNLRNLTTFLSIWSQEGEIFEVVRAWRHLCAAKFWVGHKKLILEVGVFTLTFGWRNLFVGYVSQTFCYGFPQSLRRVT